ncbi:MAG: hypothetical protein RJQ21_10360 [Rhodospirillales bacterium]
MAGLLRNLHAGSKAMSLLLGGGVVVAAIAVAATRLSAGELALRMTEIFGVTFILLLAGLVMTALYCWVRMNGSDGRQVWLEAGLQAANGITTLALTYTLLGISLGIGLLAEQSLSPETVQVVIRDLTARFSMAFLTTVVGLPLSAVLRTLLLVSQARLADARSNSR